MKRIISAATAAAGVVFVAIALAPAAHAGQVTNPADNPSPITVQGDDGNTYKDGEDTLPGYDDYECTYIPGAWLDFANNKVHYADGQSITWTEWDRATGYAAWLAKKNAPSTGGGTTTKPAPAKSTSPSPAKTTKAAPSTSNSSTSNSSSSTSSSTVTAKSGAAAVTTGQGTSDPAATTAPTPGATPVATEAGSTQLTTTGSAPVSTDGTVPEGVTGGLEGTTLAAASTTSTDGRGTAGVLILAGLAVVGALTLTGHSVFGRLARKKSTT